MPKGVYTRNITHSPWNKNTHGLCHAWNKGKTGIYSKETLTKMGNGRRGKKWSDSQHIRMSQIHKIAQNIPATKLKRSIAISQRWATPGYKEKWLQSRIGMHYSVKHRASIKRAQNRPDVKLRKHTAMCMHPNRKFSNTRIEQKIAAELTKRNISFKQNFGLDNIKNVDFYLPDYGVVIECDGCFYHACPEHGSPKHFQHMPAIDANNTKLLTTAGYHVYHFWEHAINKSTEECLNSIPLQIWNNMV